MRPPLAVALLLLMAALIVQPAAAPDVPRERWDREYAARVAEYRRLEGEAKAFHVALLVDEAAACRERHHDADALALYEQALAKDPGNVDAAAGREELLQGRRAGGHDPGPTTVPWEAEAHALREQTSFDFDTAVTDAEAAIANEDLATGESNLCRARAAACTFAAAFGPSEVEPLNLRLVRLHQCLVRDPAALDASRQREARANPNWNCFNHEAARRNLMTAVGSLVAQAQELTQVGQYDEAAQVVEQILVLDPGNEFGLGARPLLEKCIAVEREKARGPVAGAAQHPSAATAPVARSLPR